MIYRQDKHACLEHEEQELQRLAGLELRPDKAPWKTPPILQRWRPALCPATTAAGGRHRLSRRTSRQGGRRCLPGCRWSTRAFTALVESAALDLHAYVVPVHYARTAEQPSLSAPFRKAGGAIAAGSGAGSPTDCVVGGIGVAGLRQFQNGHRSPARPIPGRLPDRIEVDFRR